MVRRVFGAKTITFLRHREALGDTLELSALIRGLKQALPHYPIAVVTKRPEVFRLNPNVNEVYGWHVLRSRRTVRAAYHGKDMLDPEYHVVEIQWRRLWEELAVLGVCDHGYAPPLCGVEPELMLTGVERERGRGAVAANNRENKPVVLVSSTGKVKPVHNREWGAENFQAVCEALAPYCTLLQVGGEHVLHVQGRPIPQLVGLPVRQVAALFTACDAFVTQEGGLMHLATAVASPVIAVYGGSLLPSQTGYERNINLWGRPECSPCFGTGENCMHLKCMVNITPRRVVEAVAAMLRRHGVCDLPEAALAAAPDEWKPPAFVDRALLEQELSNVG